jgi:hypothetical protein
MVIKFDPGTVNMSLTKEKFALKYAYDLFTVFGITTINFTKNSFEYGNLYIAIFEKKPFVC